MVSPAQASGGSRHRKAHRCTLARLMCCRACRSECSFRPRRPAAHQAAGAVRGDPMVSSVRSSLLLQECKHTTALPLSHLRAPR
ncbi:MAG TPA: hypothetical protein EYQ29_13925 [Candidatus Lambdaproteobacteria bacterium]|nr:hypothetical protein [Candidatus Lambdaproteobacteria bacterium]